MNQSNAPAVRADFLSAKQALEILGVKPQTLYVYVTRGWIRAIAQRNTRGKLYSRDDIERMRMRSLARAGHGPAAASAMHWGEPVMASSITSTLIPVCRWDSSRSSSRWAYRRAQRARCSSLAESPAGSRMCRSNASPASCCVRGLSIRRELLRCGGARIASA